MMQRHYEVAIIGSGPAGYTAAIYAARANLKVVVLQGVQPGGQLTITTDVENYPGFPTGVLGPDLMVQFEQQARRMGAEIEYVTVSKVLLQQRPFVLTLDDKEDVTSDTLIIATGASAKWLGIESEQRLNGSGVSACAVCDGFFFKNQEVAIVGAGDTACEEALYLSKICSKVHMIVRRNEMRASKAMQSRVVQTTNIDIYWQSEVEEILGAHKVEGLRIRHKGTSLLIPLKAVFIAIGHHPNADLFKGKLKITEKGYIETKAGSTETNVPGVFAAGDIQDSIYRQAITAAGSGCMAALDAERYLMFQK